MIPLEEPRSVSEVELRFVPLKYEPKIFLTNAASACIEQVELGRKSVVYVEQLYSHNAFRLVAFIMTLIIKLSYYKCCWSF